MILYSELKTFPIANKRAKCYNRRRMKTTRTQIERIVLLFVRPKHSSIREKINGVYAAAIQRGWMIQPVEEFATNKRMRELARMWNPIGCLVDASAMKERIGKVPGLPIILLGRDGLRKTQAFDCSMQNVKEPAAVAAQELELFPLAAYAFIGDADASNHWSIERGEYFREALPAGASLSVYNVKSAETINERRAMTRWLKALPKPCGVLFASDHLALPFYAAASSGKMKIGSDFIVISVDNNEHICSSLSPTLTSIKLDYTRSGINAIRLLERRIANPRLPLETMTYGVLGVIRRSSTRKGYPDFRVTRAMELISEQGCEHLGIDDVVAEMKCCRRLAEKLFRRHVGSSILDAIRNVRMEKAFSLLRSRHVPIDSIPERCGYAASPGHFKTYFKSHTGMTMREWRRRHSLST